MRGLQLYRVPGELQVWAILFLQPRREVHDQNANQGGGEIPQKGTNGRGAKPIYFSLHRAHLTPP